MRVFSGIVLDSFIDKGNLFRISDGHFRQKGNKFSKFKIYDAFILSIKIS